MLTSAIPVQHCVCILLATSPPLICILISHWVHCLCIQGHSGFTALGCFYVKMMTQKMFSWHRANSALAKLDIQSNWEVISTHWNQKGCRIPREPFQTHIFMSLPQCIIFHVLLSLSKLEIAIYTISGFKSSQSSRQQLKPFVN